MIRVVVLVPVLGRPDRARPLAESLAASVTGPVVSADLLFLVSPGDHEQRAAVHELVSPYSLEVGVDGLDVEWEPGPGDYARKINAGWAFTMPRDRPRPPVYDFALFGADDLRFHPGWLEAALIVQLQTGACVVGTNDLGNAAVIRGDHATHPLVHRAYGACGTVDDPTRLLHEGYDHNFVDNEFVGTAKARGTFAPAPDSVVEHLHPIWAKGEPDETYRKGQRAYDADRRLCDARRKLWAAA